MGNTIARVRICNPREPTRCVDLNPVVDTGSTYTWVKASRLRELGIEPMARVRFRTIEGRIIEGGVGEAVIEYAGERATTIIVFAQESDAEVLGTYSLEGLKLEVDPVTRQLRKVETLLTL